MGAVIQISSVIDVLDKLISDLDVVRDWDGTIPAEKVAFRLKHYRSELYKEAYPE